MLRLHRKCSAAKLTMKNLFVGGLIMLSFQYTILVEDLALHDFVGRIGSSIQLSSVETGIEGLKLWCINKKSKHSIKLQMSLVKTKKKT